METAEINLGGKKRFYKKRWFKLTAVFLLIFIFVAGVALFKTGWNLNKIFLKGNIVTSLIRSIPGLESELKGEDGGRINILLLGMRGADLPGGGLLADTIMVVSIKPEENKAAIISIPRDFYADNPGWGGKTKINAVYAAGEENGKKQGIADMQKVVSQISGVPIHYGVTIDFEGFVDLVDALGGIEIYLEKPFSESLQFQEPHVCDGDKGGVFTVPTGKYEYKRNEKGKIVAQYPLCTNKNVECGGNFSLPAGTSQLDGKTALCYVRSRVTSNDFERARRQQEVLQKIKEKALRVGTLTDFSKVSGIMEALGNNVTTNMEPWEMKRFFDIYQNMNNPAVYQKVLENTEEGLLYAPSETGPAGYILLPRGDNYARIQELFANILNQPAP